MSEAQRGTVYLVGAGPGDPRLVTVRARALLDDCDVIVHDALVSPALLMGSRPDERDGPALEPVGKRGGDDASAKQDDINALLVRLARDGKSVVRLKGGDPFVFGRGSEEAQALASAGIPFEVVPGVTAGIAAPAYAGIPVTHRGLSAAVTFVTGHEDPGKVESQTDWSALARAGGTVVLYMGVRRLGAIVDALMAGGMPSDTPAAAIQWATYPTQQTVEATVATIAERAAAAGLQAPVVTIIGRVVALRQEIRWYDLPGARPLLGRRILVTRATPVAGVLADRLRALGAAVSEMPATRIEPLDPAPLRAALARLADYQLVVFTSQNAVRLVWEALRASGRDARALAGLTIAAVGPATSEALLAHGVAVDVPADRFVAEGVIDVLRCRTDVADARVLYPVAEGARDVLPQGLVELGATVDVVPIYRSVTDGRGAETLRAKIAAAGLDFVTFASASAVRGYVDAVGPDLAVRVGAVSIGPITSEAARAAGINVIAEARESTIAGLVAALVAVTAGSTTPPAPAGSGDGAHRAAAEPALGADADVGRGSAADPVTGTLAP
jgi:uroporphyrinogen III methyltransferase / synthase